VTNFRFSLCHLCVLCVSAVNLLDKYSPQRDKEHRGRTEIFKPVITQKGGDLLNHQGPFVLVIRIHLLEQAQTAIAWCDETK
jgi:hypothetical protein